MGKKTKNNSDLGSLLWFSSLLFLVYLAIVSWRLSLAILAIFLPARHLYLEHKQRQEEIHRAALAHLDNIKKRPHIYR